MALCLGQLAEAPPFAQPGRVAPDAAAPPLPAAPKLDEEALGDASAAIFRAGSGAGTKETSILDALRGRSPAETARLAAIFAEQYADLYPEGDPRRTLDGYLASELSDTDLAEARAHLTGDPVQATAAELLNATWGAGTDEASVQRTLERMGDLSPEQRAGVAAELKRRRRELAEEEGDLESALGTDAELDADLDPQAYLEALLTSELSSADKDAALALAQGDRGEAMAALAADALGTVSDDEEALYSAMEKLRTPAERATFLAALERRTGQTRDEILDNLAEGGERDVARCLLDGDKLGAKAAKLAAGMDGVGTTEDTFWTSFGSDPKQNRLLIDKFDAMYGEGAFWDRAGGELDKDDLERLQQKAQGGKLDTAFALRYAADGAGTDEDMFDEALRGKTKGEIDAILDDPANEGLREQILSEVSGKDKFKLERLLAGTPRTAAEKRAQVEASHDFERGSGSTWLGRNLTDLFFDDGRALDLQHTRVMNAQTDGELDQAAGFFQRDEKNLEAARDSVANGATMAAATTAGLLVVLASKGALGPVVAKALGALSAAQLGAAGAAAAGLASLGTRAAVEGDALTQEQVGIELATTAVSAMTAGAAQSGGVGKLLEALAKGGATGPGAQEAIKIAARAGGTALVNTSASAALDENVWRGPGNGLATFLEMVGKGTAGAAVGGLMTHGLQGAIPVPKGMDKDVGTFLAGGLGGAGGAMARTAIDPALWDGDWEDIALALGKSGAEEFVQEGTSNMLEQRSRRAPLGAKKPSLKLGAGVEETAAGPHPDDAKAWERTRAFMAQTEAGREALERIGALSKGDGEVAGPRLRRDDPALAGRDYGVDRDAGALVLKPGQMKQGFLWDSWQGDDDGLAVAAVAGARHLATAGDEVYAHLHGPADDFLERAMFHEAANQNEVMDYLGQAAVVAGQFGPNHDARRATKLRDMFDGMPGVMARALAQNAASEWFPGRGGTGVAGETNPLKQRQWEAMVRGLAGANPDLQPGGAAYERWRQTWEAAHANRGIYRSQDDDAAAPATPELRFGPRAGMGEAPDLEVHELTPGALEDAPRAMLHPEPRTQAELDYNLAVLAMAQDAPGREALRDIERAGGGRPELRPLDGAKGEFDPATRRVALDTDAPEGETSAAEELSGTLRHEAEHARRATRGQHPRRGSEGEYVHDAVAEEASAYAAQLRGLDAQTNRILRDGELRPAREITEGGKVVDVRGELEGVLSDRAKVKGVDGWDAAHSDEAVAAVRAQVLADPTIPSFLAESEIQRRCDQQGERAIFDALMAMDGPNAYPAYYRDDHREQTGGTKPSLRPDADGLPPREVQQEGAPAVEDRFTETGNRDKHAANRADLKADLDAYGAPRQTLINDGDLSGRQARRLAAEDKGAHPDDAARYNAVVRALAQTPMGLQALIRLSNLAQGDRDVPGQPRLRRERAEGGARAPFAVSLDDQTVEILTGRERPGLLGLGTRFDALDPYELTMGLAAGARGLALGEREIGGNLHRSEDEFLQLAMEHEANNLRVGHQAAREQPTGELFTYEGWQAYIHEHPVAKAAIRGLREGERQADGQGVAHGTPAYQAQLDHAANRALLEDMPQLQPGGDVYEKYRAMWLAQHGGQGGAYR